MEITEEMILAFLQAWHAEDRDDYPDDAAMRAGLQAAFTVAPGKWVSQETWDRWTDAAARLAALEAAGVDNWEGYSYAMAILEGDAEQD